MYKTDPVNWLKIALLLMPASLYLYIVLFCLIKTCRNMTAAGYATLKLFQPDVRNYL